MRRMFLMEYMYDNRLRGVAQPKPLSNRVERKNLAVLQKMGLKSSHKSIKKIKEAERVGIYENARRRDVYKRQAQLHAGIAA